MNDWAVLTLKRRNLAADYRMLRDVEYRCSRCGLVTSKVTEGLVHAYQVHADRTSPERAA